MRQNLLALLLTCFFLVNLRITAAQADDWVTVRVKKGDTLSRLAKRHRVTVATLRKLNRRALKGKHLRPGTRLRIKKRPTRRATRRDGRDRLRKGKRRGEKERTRAKRGRKRARRKAVSRRGEETGSRRRRRAKRSRRGKPGSWVRYKTKRGDTISRIAKRFKVRVKDLKQNNRRLRKVGENSRLKRGMRLRVKRRSKYTLVGGVLLPSKGRGYKRMRPKRSWGTPCTIQLLQDVYAEFDTRHPGSVPGLIADISDEDGGWLPPHLSHQRGVDIDVSYYKRNNERLRGLEVVTPDTIDIEKTWDLIRLFMNTGHLEMVFMDHRLQGVLHRYLKKKGYRDAQLSEWLQYPRSKKNRTGLIRHSPGHHHHLHIRFDCVRSSDPCTRPKTALVPSLGEEKPKVRTAERTTTTDQPNASANARKLPSLAIGSGTRPPTDPPPAKPPIPHAGPLEPAPTAPSAADYMTRQEIRALFGVITEPRFEVIAIPSKRRPGTVLRRAFEVPRRMVRFGATLLPKPK